MYKERVPSEITSNLQTYPETSEFLCSTIVEY